MKFPLRITGYAGYVVVAALTAFFLAGRLTMWMEPKVIGWAIVAGSTLLACGSTLYERGTKDFQQIIKDARLRSSDRLRLTGQVRHKDRTIRRVYFFGLALNAVGGAVAACLINGSRIPPGFLVKFGIFSTALAVLALFRLLAEVNQAGDLLAYLTNARIIAERREAFLNQTSAAESHDFVNDPTGISIQGPPHATHLHE